MAAAGRGISGLDPKFKAHATLISTSKVLCRLGLGGNGMKVPNHVQTTIIQIQATSDYMLKVHMDDQSSEYVRVGSKKERKGVERNRR